MLEKKESIENIKKTHMPKTFKRTFKRKVKPFSAKEYAQVARIANKQIHKSAELKSYDGTNSSWVVSSTPNIKRIDPPPQGDGDGTRDGDKIYIKSFALNAMLSPDAIQSLVMRIICFQWLEDDTTPPVVGDILQSTGATNYLFNSFYKHNPQKQFKILDDRLVFWDTNNTSTAKPYRLRLKSGDIALRKPTYKAAALDGTGNIYFCVMSNDVTGGTMRNPLARLRYYDN